MRPRVTLAFHSVNAWYGYLSLAALMARAAFTRRLAR
jgi:hypothetical protein